MPVLHDNGFGVPEPGEVLFLNGKPKPKHVGEVEAFRVSANEDDHHGWVVLRAPGGVARLLEGVVTIQPAGA